MVEKIAGAACDVCHLVDLEFCPSYYPDDWDGTTFVGEAPGANEVKEGRPFVGMSGQLLQRAYEDVGGDWDRAARTNVVLCRSVSKPTQNDIDCCSARYGERLPKKLVLLGKVAQEAHKDVSESIEVFELWHPAFVLRKPSNFKGFSTMLQRVVSGNDYKWMQEPPRHMKFTSDHIDIGEAIQYHLKSNPRTVCAWDLETDQVRWYDIPGKEKDFILMMSLTFDNGDTYIIPGELLRFNKGVRDVIRDLFDQKHITFVAHNGSFDMHFMRSIGIDNARCDFDTMLAHFVLSEEGPHGLKPLAQEYFGLFDYEEELVQKHLKNRSDFYSKVPFNDMAQYAAWDTVVTLELYKVFMSLLESEDMLEWPFRKVLMDALPHVVDIEERGMQIDRQHFERVVSEFKIEEMAWSIEMNNLAGRNVNPRSYIQLQQVIWEDRSLMPMQGALMTKNGSYSTRADQLEHLVSVNKKSGVWVREGDPFIDALMSYRRVHKMRTSYAENILEAADTNDRVHPSWLLHGTEVTRRSMRNPAMQTIPRPSDKYGRAIRSGFIAAPGHVLIHCDYEQAELRVAAALSGEKVLLDAFANGVDPHGVVAEVMYGPDYTKEQRVWAKMVNFADLYSGGNPMAVAHDAGMDLAEVTSIFAKRKQSMKSLYSWMGNQLRTMKEQGYVTTRFGYRRRFPLITNSNLADVRKASVHAVVAGSAATLTLLAVTRLSDEGFRVIHEVHDSVIVEVDTSMWLDDNTWDELEEIAGYIESVMTEIAEEWFPEVVWSAQAEVTERWAELPK